MRRTLVELAIALDPDEGRARLRRELSGAVTGEALVKLVQEIKLDGLPAATAVLAASRLVEARKGEEAALLLERAVRDHPQDLWINYTLARAEESRVHARLEEALRYYSAARAIRPETAHEQAHLLCRMGRDQEAFSIFEDLDHRNPHDVINLSCYGELMSERGDRAEGEQILSRAVEAGKMKVGLNPNDADAHVNLGNAFKFQGSLAEAEVEYREVARLKPNNAAAHFTLGDTLDKQKKLDEAIVEYREAVRLDPDYVEARFNLGNALKARDLLDEALAAYRQAERRGQPGTPSAAQLPKLIEKTEQAIKYGRRLPLVLAGTDRPKTAEEAAAFAEFCNAEARHGDAVKLWRNAFKDYPALASSRTSQSRYKAASSAVLAGCGDSQDDPKLDEAARADLRKQARTWLAAELDAWEALIKQTPQRKASVSQTLRNWRTDPNLAGIRDDAGLAKLPVAERSQCKALWARVAAILNPSAKP